MTVVQFKVITCSGTLTLLINECSVFGKNRTDGFWRGRRILYPLVQRMHSKHCHWTSLGFDSRRVIHFSWPQQTSRGEECCIQRGRIFANPFCAATHAT